VRKCNFQNSRGPYWYCVSFIISPKHHHNTSYG